MHAERRLGSIAWIWIAALAFSTTPPGWAQSSEQGFVSGAASRAWDAWTRAMAALIERDNDAAEAAFGDLMAAEPSPLRLAMFVERTVSRGNLAGGVLLLEQDAENESLGEAGQAVAEALTIGREQLNEADDGWYFASIGQFPIARANFEALLDQDPDPAALLEFADRDRRRHEILVRLTDHPVMGDTVARVLGHLALGERVVKADPLRIKQNIGRLVGPPRGFDNAVAALADSGEYAVPFLLEVLRDTSQSDFVQPVLRTMPKLGRGALNPLVHALQIKDQVVQRYVIYSLGEIGYAQAIPYLLKLRNSDGVATEVKTAVSDALRKIASGGSVATNASAADAFFALAQAYYDGAESLAADPTVDFANIWYWNEGLLENIEVPTPIFDEIMAMRCCEEALRLQPDSKQALALWLAANFRREAQLPMDAADLTRPESYPTAEYFAQSAGAEYCQLALARALKDGDAAVALGAIGALRSTAGTASLLGGPGGSPLANALSFPNKMVRIQAALTLGAARPADTFPNSQNLLPVLAEALQAYGGTSRALVVDSDQATTNELSATLQGIGFDVIQANTLFDGMQKVRNETAGINLIVLASDVGTPYLEGSLAQLASEFTFASVPVLIAEKPGDRERVDKASRHKKGIGVVTPGVAGDGLERAIRSVSASIGATTLTPDAGRGIAMQAADVLTSLAATRNAAFSPTLVEQALLTVFEADDAELKGAVAQVLAYLPSKEAQAALADVCLNEDADQDLRVRMFAALALAGRSHGNLLDQGDVERLITIAEGAGNMTIRAAASEALGALNLSSNPASAIIRNQYRG